MPSIESGLHDETGDDGLRDVTAAILAGGLGTRLRSVVADRPKVLAEVGGRPFLAYLLEQLAAAGVRRVVLCTGHLGEQIAAAFGTTFATTSGTTHGSVRLVYSAEPVPLGTGGALALARPLLGSDPALVLNGDSYCSADLKAFARWHRVHPAAAAGSVLLTRVADTRRFGRVVTGDNGALCSFVEKADAAGPGWINAGVYLLSDRLLREIPSSGAVSLERDVLPGWIGRGLYGFAAESRFLDIGTPESYAAAERFFSEPMDRAAGGSGSTQRHDGQDG